MSKIFNKEVLSWKSLYQKGDSTSLHRYAIFQNNAQKRVLHRKKLSLQLLNLQPYMKILDLGCGSGAFRESVVSTGASWIGSDISLNMLDHCKKSLLNDSYNCNHINLVNTDALTLPFRKSSFHATLCVGVFNFIPFYQAHQFLSEIYRVLKPAGILIITSLRLDLITWIRSRLYPKIPLPFSSPGPLYPMHYQKVLQHIGKTNLYCEAMFHIKKYFGLPHYTLFKFRKNG